MAHLLSAADEQAVREGFGAPPRQNILRATPPSFPPLFSRPRA
jgi:hypothetical protein